MSNNKFKILVVEDEANICSFIEALLNSNGYQPLVAQSCGMGLTLFASHNPDLVILDLGLPDRDGVEFIRSVRRRSGTPILVLSARDENYKAIGAGAGLAYGQKVGAESAVDINLAKQLNTVMTQLGVNAQSIVMNIGSAAAGYGFEYVASTLDRVKDAALSQSDAMLQMPIITPVSADTWGVKESIMPEADMPEWGSQEERGIEMEIVTAAAVLASGSDAVIMRHPEAIRTIAAMIGELV